MITNKPRKLITSSTLKMRMCTQCNVTNAINAIANQVIQNLGRSSRNAGLPYFDGTYRDYPAFNRKFLPFQANYHTQSRELVQQFREMFLPGNVTARTRKVEYMETICMRLDVMYNDHTAFIKGLMQETRSVSLIKDGEDERLMDYYVLLQSHIEEAHRAVLVSMLLIPANMEEMVLTLPHWEKSIWEK